MKGEQPARYTRLKDDRNLKLHVTDCCKSPIPRYKPIGAGICDVCGTHLAITEKGHIFYAFGKDYFKIREEIVRKKKEGYSEEGIPIEMPVKRARVLVE